MPDDISASMPPNDFTKETNDASTRMLDDDPSNTPNVDSTQKTPKVSMKEAIDESTKNTNNDPTNDDNNNSTNKRKRPDDSAESERAGKRFLEALEEHENITIPKGTEEHVIETSRSPLSRHMEETSALFFVELTPSSSARGAGCRFLSCKERIREDDYRIAVYPGMYSVYRSADFYHTACFEKLVDFSKTEYMKRVQPVTRSSYYLRDLKGTSISSGNYLLDGGAERLVLHWVDSMHRLIAKRDGTEQEDPTDDVELRDILYKAGSASFKPKQPKGMSDFEYFNLCGPLATVESDGVDDEEEWNLIDEYVPLTFNNLEDLNVTDSLSCMIYGPNPSKH